MSFRRFHHAMITGRRARIRSHRECCMKVLAVAHDARLQVFLSFGVVRVLGDGVAPNGVLSCEGRTAQGALPTNGQTTHKGRF